MFVCLNKLKTETIAPRSVRYHMSLMDRDFTDKFISLAKYYNDPRIAVQVIRSYKNRKRNVARELNRYYEYLYNSGFDLRGVLANHFYKIDLYDSTLNYRQQYHPLLSKIYLRHHM